MAYVGVGAATGGGCGAADIGCIKYCGSSLWSGGGGPKSAAESIDVCMPDGEAEGGRECDDPYDKVVCNVGGVERFGADVPGDVDVGPLGLFELLTEFLLPPDEPFDPDPRRSRTRTASVGYCECVFARSRVDVDTRREDGDDGASGVTQPLWEGGTTGVAGIIGAGVEA